MSTRSVIARKTKDGFKGTYHHWDGYPTGLGVYLFNLFRSSGKSLKEFTREVITKHPSGYSTLVTSAPGTPYGTEKPECFCHDRVTGKRNKEKKWDCNHENAAGSGCEYAYVFSMQAGKPVMEVLSSISSTGSKMIGMFGMGDPDSQWALLARVVLTDPMPDFAKIEKQAFEDSDSYSPDQLNC